MPASDEEAVERILDVAEASLARSEPVRIVDVARVLGVTRQTVYRYFPNNDAILTAMALRSADGFLDQMADRLRGMHDPVSVMVEALAFSVETLVADEHIRILVTGGGPAADGSTSLTTDTARAFGRATLRRFEVDWEAWGFDESGLDELAEFSLRVLSSFLLDERGPVDSARRGTELRRFLRRWIGPAIVYPRAAAAMEPLDGSHASVTSLTRRQQRDQSVPTNDPPRLRRPADEETL